MVKRISLAAGAALIASAVFGVGFATGQSGSTTMATLSELNWQPVAEGSDVMMVVLWGDPAGDDHARLFRLPAGFEVPVHMHTPDYHGINLTGTWRHYEDGGASRDLPPGSYVAQAGGGMHGDACVGPVDCIIFNHMHGPADFIAKE